MNFQNPCGKASNTAGQNGINLLIQASIGPGFVHVTGNDRRVVFVFYLSTISHMAMNPEFVKNVLRPIGTYVG